jgi:hypothetical protein
MNRFENWFCASTLWRNITKRQVLPWLLAGSDLGDHILEIGAGSGHWRIPCSQASYFFGVRHRIGIQIGFAF